MKVPDVIRRELALAAFDFWLEVESVPRRRRRAEGRELRATLDDIAAEYGMRQARRRVGPVRALAQAVGEGYADRPRRAAGLWAALPVFGVLAYSYLFSCLAYLEGVRASGVSGRTIESTNVMPWLGVPFEATVRADGGIDVGGPIPWVLLALPVIVFVVARPWRVLKTPPAAPQPAAT